MISSFSGAARIATQSGSHDDFPGGIPNGKEVENANMMKSTQRILNQKIQIFQRQKLRFILEKSQKHKNLINSFKISETIPRNIIL